MANDDADVPHTPLVGGEGGNDFPESGSGPPYQSRRPISKGKLVFILTLIFAAILITAIIIVTVRSGEDGPATPSPTIPPCRNDTADEDHPGKTSAVRGEEGFEPDKTDQKEEDFATVERILKSDKKREEFVEEHPEFKDLLDHDDGGKDEEQPLPKEPIEEGEEEKDNFDKMAMVLKDPEMLEEFVKEHPQYENLISMAQSMNATTTTTPAVSPKAKIQDDFDDSFFNMDFPIGASNANNSTPANAARPSKTTRVPPVAGTSTVANTHPVFDDLDLFQAAVDEFYETILVEQKEQESFTRASVDGDEQVDNDVTAVEEEEEAVFTFVMNNSSHKDVSDLPVLSKRPNNTSPPANQNDIVGDVFDINESGKSLTTDDVVPPEPIVGVEDDEEYMSCLPNEYHCEDNKGMCYGGEEKCNNVVFCGDSSDEKDCPCSKLINATKLCDGIFDCPDGSDEGGSCSQCPPGHRECSHSGQVRCVPSADICNNLKDCEDATDEEGCPALAPENFHLDPSHVATPYSEGILYWKVQGLFHQLSLEFSPRIQARKKRILEDFGFRVCQSVLPDLKGVPVVRSRPYRASTDPNGRIAHLSIDKEDALLEDTEFNFVVAYPTANSTTTLIQCGEPECGLAYSALGEKTEKDENSVANKIVGGVASSPKEWPATVGIRKDGKFICGGTIVSANWIVTAAHCVVDFYKNNNHFEAVAGMLRKNSPSVYRVAYVISEIHIHPDYNRATFMNDIAMARTSTPIFFNAYTSVACLPDPEDTDYDVTEGNVCVAVGWGNVAEDGDPAEHMQQAEIPIYSECTKSYNDIEFQICGGKVEGGVDTCQGDSGGPLFCKYSPDKWFLAGIISHGMGCARPEEPGAYSRVSAYIDFISSVTSQPEVSIRNEASKHRANPLCPTHVCSGLCIERRLLCNGIRDCLDSSDEINCSFNQEGVKVFTPPSHSTATAVGFPMYAAQRSGAFVTFEFNEQPRNPCPPNTFQCTNIHQCIPEKETCNFSPDCVDSSDEHECTCVDYLKKLKPDLLCDGYPDCPMWEDEKDCHVCNYGQFYCDLSETCIDKAKVCDKQRDCRFGEDERYCLTLFSTDSVSLQKDGRPFRNSKGFLAFNVQGHWIPVCTKTWNKDLNDRVCRYLNYKDGSKFITVNTRDEPFLKDTKLRTRLVDGHLVFPRSVRENSNREKRQSNSDCRFVDIECNDSPACGVMPLYSNLGSQTPIRGRGVFPWQVTIYQNGLIACGATLVHRHWILTHTDCISKFNLVTDTVVARAGGHREQITMSKHDQYRRVLYFSAIPQTNIALGLLQDPFELNEYVNTVCIPSVTWVPYLQQCYISGKFEESLNHIYQTQIIGVCDYKSDHEYYFCTNQTTRTSECLNNWSGALVCPDDTGTFYAVGVYHSENGNCGFGQEPAPDKFQTLVSGAAREGIVSIMESVKISDLNNFNSPDNCPTLQCPNGKCLLEEHICDYYPHCHDLSDEKGETCEGQVPPMCQPFNSTHCQCRESQMLCSNGMCLDKNNYCNQVDDCGDGTDEPENCENDCPGYLSIIDPVSVCNGKINCQGIDDIGTDESAELCCQNDTLNLQNDQYPYRCAIGPLVPSSYVPAVITDQCINSKGVCDWDNVPTSARCNNGADELDCVNIWPSLQIGDGDNTKDPFGRYKTNRVGYLYFVAFGRKFLYCAGPDTWTSQYTQEYGKILCKNEGFPGLGEIRLFEPISRTRIGLNDIVLVQPEESNYNRCLLVYITCHDKVKN